MASSDGRKRREPRVVEDAQFGGFDLDFAGRHLGIDGILAAQADLADGGDDILRPHLLAFEWPSGVSSLSSTTWAMPLRSRTSRKIRLPWSRRRFTQPIRTTLFAGVGGAQVRRTCGCVPDCLKSRARCQSLSCLKAALVVPYEQQLWALAAKILGQLRDPD